MEVEARGSEVTEVGMRLDAEVAACGSFSHGSNLEAAMRPEKGLGHNLRHGPGGLCPQLLKSLPSLPKQVFQAGTRRTFHIPATTALHVLRPCCKPVCPCDSLTAL